MTVRHEVVMSLKILQTLKWSVTGELEVSASHDVLGTTNGGSSINTHVPSFQAREARSSIR